MNSRKIVGSLLVVVLILAASAIPGSAFSTLLPQGTRTPGSQPLSLESLLPTDALGVIIIDNVAQLKAALSKTEFYQIASAKSSNDPVAKSFREAVDKMAGRSLRAALVFVAPQTGDRQPKVAIVIQGQSSAAIKTGVAKIEAAYKANGSDQIQGTPFIMATTQHQVDGETVSFARYENIFIYGQQTAVEKVASTLKSASTLSSDPTFQQAREKRAPDGVMFTYVNVSVLLSYVIQVLTSKPRATIDMLSMLVPALQFAGAPAIKSASIATRYQNGRAVDQVHGFISWERAGLLSALLLLPPYQPRAAQSLPLDASAYVSLGIDSLQIYDALLKTWGPLITMQLGTKSADEAVKTLEQRLGFRIREELLASLGTELVIAQIKTPGSAPDAFQTNTLILVEVKDAELLKSVLEKNQASRASETEPVASVEIYKGRKIYPLTEKYSIGVIGPFAALANIDEIKRLTDQLDQGRSLASAESYKRTFGNPTSPHGIEVFVTSDVLNHPHARRAMSREGAQSVFVEALRANFNPVLYGTGGRNNTGLTVEIVSPIGAPLIWDFLQTEWQSEATRLTASETGGIGSPLLHLISHFSRAFDSVVSRQ